MGFPDRCQLVARFLEPQLIAHGFGFVALLGLDGCQLAEFRVEPLLADFQRGKALIPSLFATRAGLDVNTFQIRRKEKKKTRKDPF